jgi:TPR repeat protein
MAGQGFHQLPEGRRDDAKAVAAYQRGCELGEPESCGNLGLLYEKGWGTAQDLGRAASLYERACENHVPIACRNLGKLNEGESGHPVNRQRAASAYRRALDLALEQCDQGIGESCATAGYMYQDGKGTSVDESRGAELTKKACSIGYSWACKPREKR